MPNRKPPAFKSVAQRKAIFATNPPYGREVASKTGAKIRGGFTKAQLQRRRSAAGQGKPYTPKPR